ncbi:MAG: DUF3221 domain-containing protein [Actinomycetota bacterium]|nr:MAG: hypothetical protein FD171_174 [Actinomycetota bacterium]MDO8950574.1 DUF3221 domain-containing protein [Actinomycetota bacterium]MDP3629567.1 DUF3221 domain-containing protein [Actinomycetota bacterium]
MRTRSLAVVAVLSATLLLSGCLPGPPSAEPSIRGTITSLTPGDGNLGAIMVEGTAGAGTSYDKASVNVTGTTKVLLRGADGYGRLTYAELKVGDAVEVWFTGAVAESYPVQATGGTIVVVP